MVDQFSMPINTQVTFCNHCTIDPEVCIAIFSSEITTALHLFDHIYQCGAALYSAMILYRRFAKGHGVTENMVIGNTEPPRQIWQ